MRSTPGVNLFENLGSKIFSTDPNKLDRFDYYETTPYHTSPSVTTMIWFKIFSDNLSITSC